MESVLPQKVSGSCDALSGSLTMKLMRRTEKDKEEETIKEDQRNNYTGSVIRHFLMLHVFVLRV